MGMRVVVGGGATAQTGGAQGGGKAAGKASKSKAREGSRSGTAQMTNCQAREKNGKLRACRTKVTERGGKLQQKEQKQQIKRRAPAHVVIIGLEEIVCKPPKHFTKRKNQAHSP